ncbi:MAG: flippase-like domain-containing protein [Bacteroidetes bacterium]|nr:flippase-like domain-containing protein [Bacteroidota bacterium]
MIPALRNLFFLAIGGVLLWLTFRNHDFSLVWEKVKTANPWWLGLSCLCSMAALISRAMRWIQLIEPLGYKPRLSTTYHAVTFAYLANMAVPRLGEISRCGALKKSDNVPFEKLVGTVIIERLADVFMLLVCIAMTAFLEFDLLGGFLYKQIIGPAIEKVGNGTFLIVILLIIAVIAGGSLYALFRMSNPPALIQKIRGFALGLGDGLKSITKVKNKGLFLFHSLFIWTMYFMMSYLCFFALPETTSLGPSAALFIMVLGGIGMTAPVQGGIGTYHLLVSQGLLLYGLSETDGLVYATMSHAIATLLLILLGALSMISLFFFVKNRNSATA